MLLCVNLENFTAFVYVKWLLILAPYGKFFGRKLKKICFFVNVKSTWEKYKTYCYSISFTYIYTFQG